MNSRPAIFLCTAAFLMLGCTPRSSIDAKKSSASQAEISSNKTAITQQLSDKDIFGNETTLAVSEEDIQAALEGKEFHVPLNSSVILVQSGSRAPEGAMQEELRKYYSVSTFSGIPDRQKSLSCNKDEDGNVIASENMNYMQALRYVAAKGHQKAIIVYQEVLQSGKYDLLTKSMAWTDYKNEKHPSASSLRFLVRFTLVDVATGEWASWSPANYESSMVLPVNGTADTTEQQIMQIKQKTYAAGVKDLVNRYQ